MTIRQFLVVLICALLLALLLYTRYSNGPEKATSKNETSQKNAKEVYNKILKEREQRAIKARQYIREDEVKREKQVAVAEACLKQYDSCVGKCKNSPCEGNCVNALSVCEKDLPVDLKTIK